MDIKCFNQQQLPQLAERRNIAQFLHKHLGKYGDPIAAIEKCISYALSEQGKAGGFILTAFDNEVLISALIINKTGMSDFIPEHILVYIATHQDYRGKGIGKKMIQQALQLTDTDMALHVEPDNPAKRLYEKLGFTNKYLEMRFKK